MKHDEDLAEFDLYAYVGEDEYGSGEIGLKQAFVPAGIIPLVTVDRAKAQRADIERQMVAQAKGWGKPIRLIRLTYVETIETYEGR